MPASGTWRVEDKTCPVTGRVCTQAECAWWCPAHAKRGFGTCAVTLLVVQQGTIINTLKHRIAVPGQEAGECITGTPE